MKGLIKNSIECVTKMTQKERTIKLCELATKEHLGVLMPHEIIQLNLIQEIRKANGEIEKVLKTWAENPELDPRLQ